MNTATQQSFFPHSAEDKRAGILAAAVEIFGQRGFHRASMAAIANSAGVATGSIYNYFDGKEVLLAELFSSYMDKYLSLQNEALEKERGGMEQLNGFCGRHLKVFANDRNLARVFHVHWREAQVAVRDEIRPTLKSYFDLIARVLEDGVQSGSFRVGLDIRMASKLVVGSLDQVVSTWVLAHQERNLGEQADHLASLLARAFG